MKINKDKLRKLLKDNPDMTFRDLAKIFGCSFQAIQIQVKRLGIEHRTLKRTTLTDKRIKKTIIENPDLTYEEIGKKLDLSGATIANRARKYGISRKIDHDSRAKKILEHIESQETMNYAKIARELELPPQYVANVIRKEKKLKPKNTPIDMKKLKKLLEENPDMKRKDLAKALGCETNTITSAKRRLKHPKKKHQHKRYHKLDWEKAQKIIKDNPDLSIPALAEIIGVAPNTLGDALRRHGIMRGHKRKIDYEALRKDLNETNLTTKELAEKYGVCLNAIAFAKTKMGIKKKEYHHVQATKEEILKYLNDNPHATNKEIAEHFGESSSAMSRFRIREGIQHVEKREKISKLLLASKQMSFKEIAAKTAASESYVKVIAKRLFGTYSQKGRKVNAEN